MACPDSPSAEDLTTFLQRNDPEHDALSFSWNDTMSRWSLEEVALVCRAVASNTTITSLPVNLMTVVEELTAQVLGCFPQVTHLQLACPFTRRDDAVPPDVVDSLLRGMASSKSDIKSLETTRSGGAHAIVEFCQRFTHLESLALGIGYRSCDLTRDFEQAVALAIGSLRTLKRVSLFCNRSVAQIVLSLVACPTLEKAELVVVDDQLDDVARLCTFSRSLKEVTVEAYAIKLVAQPFLIRTWFQLETLTLQNFYFSPFDYPPQSSVRSLTLTECTLDPGSLVVLQSFPNLQTLRLSGCVYQDDQCQHTIHTLLRNLPQLHSFESTYLERVSESEVSALTETNNNNFVAGIAQALSSHRHPNLKSVTLKLYGERIESGDRPALYFPALRDLMRHVPTLCLYCTEFAYNNLHHVMRGLEDSNATLRHLTLHLEDCRLADADYATFFQTVTQTCLTSFCLDFDGCEQLNEGGINVALVHMLQHNTTLETLELYYVNGSLFHELLDCFMEGLVHNSRLSRVCLQQNAVGSVLVERDAAQSLLELVRDSNTTLRTLEPLAFAENAAPFEMEILHYLKLNRYGRQFLRSPAVIPASVWPLIVGKIVTNRECDVLFHFLRVMPSLVRTRGGGLRRGRNLNHHHHRGGGGGGAVVERMEEEEEEED